MREEAWQTGCAACQRRCVINVLNRQRTFHVPCLPLPLFLLSILLCLACLLCVYLRVQQFEPDLCGLMS